MSELGLSSASHTAWCLHKAKKSREALTTQEGRLNRKELLQRGGERTTDDMASESGCGLPHRASPWSVSPGLSACLLPEAG